jgi:hypothetical protein
MTELLIAVLAAAAGVFAASAAAKLRSRAAYRSFRTSLRETRLLSERRLASVTRLLVASEAAVAASLSAAAVAAVVAVPGSRLLTAAALTAAAALTGTLLAGVAVVVHRGTRAQCACFGGRSARPLGWSQLARNGCLLGVLVAGLAGDLLGGGSPGLAGALLAVAAGGVAAPLFTHWDELVSLFAPLSPARPPRSAWTARADRRAR